MTSPTLVVLAAGLATRYGGLKQLAPVGPSGETLVDYAVYDAHRAGFDHVVYVVRRDIEAAFRRHVQESPANAPPATFAYQDIPKGRKPWGAAHALLAARDEVHGPFAVANADDFYGADAYMLMYGHLTKTLPSVPSVPSVPLYAVAGYRLDETLSPYGGVSRALCEVDGGYVRRMEEMSRVRRAGDDIVGIDESGARRTIAGDAIVCTNLWALTPDVFPTLARQVSRFMKESASERETELPLSTAMGRQIRTGEARLAMLRPSGRCFGMTYNQDVPAVRRAIADLVRSGAYPRALQART